MLPPATRFVVICYSSRRKLINSWSHQFTQTTATRRGSGVGGAVLEEGRSKNEACAQPDSLVPVLPQDVP